MSALRVIWPEGQPQHAVQPDGLLAPFGRFGYSLGWAMHGLRTRSCIPAKSTDHPVTVAHACEAVLRRRGDAA